MKQINIITSSDDNLAPLILPQIASIAENLRDCRVNFYLLHYRISTDNIKLLLDYSNKFDNITFCELIISDPSPYIKLASPHGGSGAGNWPAEAYFSLCCHQYLPKETERALYIDAGDIIFNGSIDDFYLADFEGMTLLAAYPKIYKQDGTPLGRDDLSDTDIAEVIMRGGIFNSGSLVFNIKKMNDIGLTIKDFSDLTDILLQNVNNKQSLWFGDQGLLSLAFAGDIKYFELEKFLKDTSYTPYNFGMWYGARELNYTPKIIHYTDTGGYFKPWTARFDEWNPQLPQAVPYKKLSERHIMWHEIWWKYCKMTPIYDALNKTARAQAKMWEDTVN